MFNDYSPQEFFQQLYHVMPRGFSAVTFLAPEGVAPPRGMQRSITNFKPLPMQSEIDLTRKILPMNERGYSVYFRVMVQSTAHGVETRIKDGFEYPYYPRGKADESIYTRALWGEIDFKDFGSETDARKYLDNLKYAPSMVVRSGGGLHLYWLLREILATNGGATDGFPPNVRVTPLDAKALKRTLKGIAVAMKGDTKVAELGRIMRLPGTVNTKPERSNAPCYVESASLVSYNYIDLELEYAPLVAPERRQTERKDSGLQGADNAPEWVKQYVQYGAAQGARNDTLFKAACVYAALGIAKHEAYNVLGQRARLDGLSDGEIDTAIESAYGSERSMNRGGWRGE